MNINNQAALNGLWTLCRQDENDDFISNVVQMSWLTTSLYLHIVCVCVCLESHSTWTVAAAVTWCGRHQQQAASLLIISDHADLPHRHHCLHYLHTPAHCHQTPCQQQQLVELVVHQWCDVVTVETWLMVVYQSTGSQQLMRDERVALCHSH